MRDRICGFVFVRSLYTSVFVIGCVMLYKNVVTLPSLITDRYRVVMSEHTSSKFKSEGNFSLNVVTRPLT